MSTSTPTRRGLFAGGAALAGAAAIPALPSGAAVHPDAELLAACARMNRAEAEYRRLTDAFFTAEVAEPNIRKPSAALLASRAAMQAFVDGEYADARAAFLEAQEPQTPAGARAFADAVWQHYQPDPPDSYGMGSAMWDVICIASGRPAARLEDDA